jgi:hypothetical protein
MSKQNETTENFQLGPITPYYFQEVATDVLGRDFPPQTFYGYARSGAIASNYQQWLADGGKKSGYKVLLDGDAATEWLKGNLNGTITTPGKPDTKAIAAQFRANLENGTNEEPEDTDEDDLSEQLEASLAATESE